MPAGDVVLAAIAAQTERMHLGPAVTVLSSDDPMRVLQRYSTLNAISHGRAEVILGRGSSIESFPLFGYDLADYEELFLVSRTPTPWPGA
jgi:alkanesulfonate monooxygenase SsuD/methylene tetrahydromethanopterin reductase-like flavin-dependent oxidoreductase (luciferase family)